MPTEELGNEIRRYREAKGLSLVALAAKLPLQDTGNRVAGQSISNWERGHFKPPSRMLAAIEEELDIPDHRLLRLAGFLIDDANLEDRVVGLEDWAQQQGYEPAFRRRVEEAVEDPSKFDRLAARRRRARKAGS